MSGASTGLTPDYLATPKHGPRLQRSLQRANNKCGASRPAWTNASPSVGPGPEVLRRSRPLLLRSRRKCRRPCCNVLRCFMPDLPRFTSTAEPSDECSGGTDSLRGDRSEDSSAVRAEVVALTHRLHEAVQARVKAEQANEASQVVLAAQAHELRAPLGTILLYAQLLREGDVHSAVDLRQIGDSLERAVREQTQLIDQLLDGSHGGASPEPLELSDGERCSTQRHGDAAVGRTTPRARRSLDRPGKLKQYGTLKDVRILYIDDDFHTREAVFEVLELAGARVALAASTADGIMALDTFKPQAILCDISMPGEDGYAFMRKLRASELGQGCAIPVLAFTGYATVEDKRAALAAGFQMYLSKPIDIDRLRDSVAQLIGLIGSKQLVGGGV